MKANPLSPGGDFMKANPLSPGGDPMETDLISHGGDDTEDDSAKQDGADIAANETARMLVQFNIRKPTKPDPPPLPPCFSSPLLAP
jgi:hypothetical protein